MTEPSHGEWLAALETEQADPRYARIDLANVGVAVFERKS